MTRGLLRAEPWAVGLRPLLGIGVDAGPGLAHSAHAAGRAAGAGVAPEAPASTSASYFEGGEEGDNDAFDPS